MKEAIERSGLPCLFKENALCTTRCKNHLDVLSSYVTAGWVKKEVELAGKELSVEKLGELIVDGIQEGMMDGSIKEIDCSPTFPESQ